MATGCRASGHKYYTQKPTTPKPVKRGGKARRKLMELTDMQRAQREALNAKIDIALSNSMMRLLREKMR